MTIIDTRSIGVGPEGPQGPAGPQGEQGAEGDTTALSTGILSGGGLSINGGDATKLDIAAGVGIIVDHSSFPPTVTQVSWSAFTAVTLTNLATLPSTDIAINSSGSVVQQTRFSTVELRSHILLGGVDHSGNTVINNVFSIQVPAYSIGLSVRDLASAIGDLNLSGNIISSNGTNLKIDKSSGIVFSFGRNAVNNQSDPHSLSVDAVSAVSFQYARANGSGGTTFSTFTSDIDPTRYDDGSGTLVVATANRWTVQQVLFFANSSRFFVQYGSDQFVKKSDAIQSIASLSRLVGLRTALVRCFLVVKTNATDLSVVDDVEFIEPGKFGTIGGAGSQGDAGPAGETGATGPEGPAGPGLPVGGTVGQIITKVDGTDYNTTWSDAPSGGGGFDPSKHTTIFDDFLVQPNDNAPYVATMGIISTSSAGSRVFDRTVHDGGAGWVILTASGLGSVGPSTSGTLLGFSIPTLVQDPQALVAGHKLRFTVRSRFHTDAPTSGISDICMMPNGLATNATRISSAYAGASATDCFGFQVGSPNTGYGVDENTIYVRHGRSDGTGINDWVEVAPFDLLPHIYTVEIEFIGTGMNFRYYFNGTLIHSVLNHPGLTFRVYWGSWLSASSSIETVKGYQVDYQLVEHIIE